MKILICLNQDIYCLAALNYISNDLKDHQIKLYFSSHVGKAPDNKFLQELKLYEKQLSHNKVSLFLEQRTYGKEHKKFIGTAQLSKKYNMEILSFNKINLDGIEFLKKNWTPELIISIRFGQIFKEEIISMPKYGIINLHSGILPNYRGIMASFWAILHNEEYIGTTLHFIDDSSIDTGRIIAISQNKVNNNKSFMENVFSIYTEGCNNIIKAIGSVESGIKINSTPQDKDTGNYFSYPNDDDINKFLKKLPLL